MPKIIGGSLVEHREQIRRRVFEAFAALMAERSFAAISMADLAARAGVGRTALYNHFRDREAVLVEFAGDETARYVARLEEALAGAAGPLEQMRAYVRQHLALADELHVGFGPELNGMLSGDSLVQIREHVRDVEQVLRRIIEDGRACGDFTVRDVDAAVSLVHACLQRRDADPAAVEDFVLGGLS